MNDIVERPGGGGRCLLVSCHPLSDSLCHFLVKRIQTDFAAHHVEVDHLDLYAGGFSAPLSVEERRSYFSDRFDDRVLRNEIAALQRAEILILVFPTWWFGFPALLKGWFDRVWAPGVAFDHPVDGGRITPCLANLKQCLAVTTLGSPWWFDRLILRRPLRRILKKALVRTCAPAAAFQMLSIYDAMNLDDRRLERFAERIDAAVLQIAQAVPMKSAAAVA